MTEQQSEQPHPNPHITRTMVGTDRAAVVTDEWGDRLVALSGSPGLGIIGTAKTPASDLEAQGFEVMGPGVWVTAQDLRDLADILDSGGLT